MTGLETNELRDFLRSRRARLSPADAGLPDFGGRRRVPGLRREEVALLAGISTDYYIRLERGQSGEVSDAVLEGIARALQLDAVERDHLVALMRPLRRPRSRSRAASAPPTVRPQVQLILDHLPTPAYVRNARMDVLAANPVGRALYAPVMDSAVRTREGAANTALFCFLDPQAERFYVDWNRVSANAVGILHAAAARDPHDPALQELIGMLSTRSDRFRELWGRHDVHRHQSGTKQLRHPLVGELELDYEAFDMPDSEGLRVNVYVARPGSESAERIALLGSWAATDGEPGGAEPAGTKPGVTEPGSTEFGSAEPGSTELGSTEGVATQEARGAAGRGAPSV